jgi:hypothetical protein
LRCTRDDNDQCTTLRHTAIELIAIHDLGVESIEHLRTDLAYERLRSTLGMALKYDKEFQSFTSSPWKSCQTPVGSSEVHRAHTLTIRFDIRCSYSLIDQKSGVPAASFGLMYNSIWDINGSSRDAPEMSSVMPCFRNQRFAMFAGRVAVSARPFAACTAPKQLLALCSRTRCTEIGLSSVCIPSSLVFAPGVAR